MAELNKEENDINRRTECLLRTIAALNEMGVKIQSNIASPEDKAATRPAIIVKGDAE
jgi:hypothetical protein